MKIFVKVKPGSREDSVKKISETNFQVCVKALPDKGKANKALIVLLADYFNVSLSQIEILSGTSAHQKIIEINK